MSTARRVIGAALVAFAIAGCASTRPQIEDLAGGAHAMTQRSGLSNVRSRELKVQLEEAALAYCKARGQALTMYDTRTEDPDPPALSTATIQFRCVAP